MTPLLLTLALLQAPQVDPELQSFATNLEYAIKQRNIQGAESRIDTQRLIERSIEGIQASPEVRDGYIRATLRDSTGKKIIHGLGKTGSFKLLHFHQVDGKPHALFRLITSDGGINYYDFALEKDSSGSVKASDVFIYSNGTQMSQKFRRNYVLTVADADPKFRNMLGGREREFLNGNSTAALLYKAQMEQNWKEAMTQYNKLPPLMKRDKTYLIHRLTAAYHLSPHDYDQAYAEFHKLYPTDPAADLISIDAYMFRKAPSGALAALDKLDKEIEDPYLDHFRANIYLQENNRKLAESYFQRSISREPTLRNPYWGLLAMYSEDNNYKLMAKYLTALEKDAGVKIGDLTKIPVYSGFVKSAEYQEWQRSRGR